MTKAAHLLLLSCAALVAVPAYGAEGSVGGYMRVMTRPDFQGGDGRLGYWNLYGRLLNEGPFVALESQLSPRAGARFGRCLDTDSRSDRRWLGR